MRSDEPDKAQAEMPAPYPVFLRLPGGILHPFRKNFMQSSEDLQPQLQCRRRCRVRPVIVRITGRILCLIGKLRSLLNKTPRGMRTRVKCKFVTKVSAYKPGMRLLALSADICSARTEMERRKAPALASRRAVDLLIIDFKLIVERKAEYEISLKISETTLEAVCGHCFTFDRRCCRGALYPHACGGDPERGDFGQHI